MNDLGSKHQVAGTSWDVPTIPQSTPIYEQVPVVVPTPIRMAPMPEQMVEHDLPPEFVAQGWKRFWSKRENRPYFWNKVSGESLWEMPVLKGSFDPITDPLGICDPSQGVGPVQPPLMGIPMKRRAPEEVPPIPHKKFILAYVLCSVSLIKFKRLYLLTLVF